MSYPPGYEASQYREMPQAQPPLSVPVPPQPVLPAQQYGVQPVIVQPHSPGLAVVASFFFPGLGSMLNDQVGKGVLILCCYIVAAITCLIVIGFLLTPAVWIWGMIAANNDARNWNRAHGILC